MVALNVDRSLVAKVARAGFEATTPEEREGSARRRRRTRPNRARLAAIHASHTQGAAGLEGFVAAQLVWDKRWPTRAGRGGAGGRAHPSGSWARVHAERFEGVPHQLAALGRPRPAVLLPWDDGRDAAS